MSFVAFILIPLAVTAFIGAITMTEKALMFHLHLSSGPGILKHWTKAAVFTAISSGMFAQAIATF